MKPLNGTTVEMRTLPRVGPSERGVVVLAAFKGALLLKQRPLRGLSIGFSPQSMQFIISVKHPIYIGQEVAVGISLEDLTNYFVETIIVKAEAMIEAFDAGPPGEARQ